MSELKNPQEEQATTNPLEGLDNVENELNRSAEFVEKNIKPLAIGIVAVVAVVLAIFLYRSFILAPKEQEAARSLYKAENLFARDSFNLALNGDENVTGFLEIIKEYGSTDAGEVAKAYAGLCYKGMGEYEKAIQYLKGFDNNDKMLTPTIKGAIGDCYLELKDINKAIDFYKKAASADNEFVTPVYLHRMGETCLKAGKTSEALKAFEELKKKYPNSSVTMDADKFIELAKASK
ncbi:MAG: tetratricopeptide repeat protein [Paludibacteraceae bacterium]|nr:tetratricopeptide repeat protein [Paludibacteraceae bacterium]